MEKKIIIIYIIWVNYTAIKNVWISVFQRQRHVIGIEVMLTLRNMTVKAECALKPQTGQSSEKIMVSISMKAWVIDQRAQSTSSPLAGIYSSKLNLPKHWLVYLHNMVCNTKFLKFVITSHWLRVFGCSWTNGLQSYGIARYHSSFCPEGFHSLMAIITNLFSCIL